MNLVQPVILKKDKKDICLTSYTLKTKSKDKKNKKNVAVLSTARPLHEKTIDDDKEKPQVTRFYDFTKGGTDIVDQLNDYYTTRAKSCGWVLLALSYVDGFCWLSLTWMGFGGSLLRGWVLLALSYRDGFWWLSLTWMGFGGSLLRGWVLLALSYRDGFCWLSLTWMGFAGSLLRGWVLVALSYVDGFCWLSLTWMGFAGSLLHA